jgi:hypothetical protein
MSNAPILVMSALARIAVLSVLAGCSSTFIASTWKSPTLGAVTFDRVVVIAHARGEAARRTMEDQLVSRLSVPAVASYTLSSQAPVEEQLHELVLKGNFNGAIVMRVAAVDREADWVPGTWIGPYWGAFGWGMFDPGYYEIDTYVRVETNMYTLPDEQLVWAASSSTVNPTSVKQLVNETMNKLAKELPLQRLVARPES